MVKIGPYLVNPERVDMVEDTHNRAAHPGVYIYVRGDGSHWVPNMTLEQAQKILERDLSTL